jgi:hypothetical protein
MNTVLKLLRRKPQRTLSSPPQPQPLFLEDPPFVDEPDSDLLDDPAIVEDPAIVDDFEQNECGICTEELYPQFNSHDLISFTCGHIFHIICVIDFIETNARIVITTQRTELDKELYTKLVCPLCRANMTYDKLIQIDANVKKYIRKLQAQKRSLEKKKKYNKENPNEYVDKIAEVVEKHTEAVYKYAKYADTLEQYRRKAMSLGEDSFCQDYVFENFVYYNICAICTKKLEDPTNIFTNDCGHQFHKNCLTYKELGIINESGSFDPTDTTKLICPVPACGTEFNLDILKSIDTREKQKIFELDKAKQIAVKTRINFKETVNPTARAHIIKAYKDANDAYTSAEAINGDFIEAIKNKYKDYMLKDLKYYFQTDFPEQASREADAYLALAAGPKVKVTRKRKDKHKRSRKRSFNKIIKRLSKGSRP